jgi:predicted nucleotidyltransferase
LGINIDIIIKEAPKDFQSLILFGSYARGDFEKASDVDVALISEERDKTISVGNINYTVYTIEQLIKMAQEGSIFIYHLLFEGVELEGNNILDRIKKEFHKPKNYQEYRRDLEHACVLMNIEKSTYISFFEKYNTLCLYLLRSYIYSQIMDSASISFSKKRVLEFIDVNSYYKVENLAHDKNNCCYESFLETRDLVFKNLNYRKDITANLFPAIVNSYTNNKLTYILGMRLANPTDNLLDY